MATLIVTPLRSESEWLPHIGDYDSFVFKYSIIDAKHRGKPNEETFARQQSVKIKVSRTTQTAWKLAKPNLDLDKVVFQFALDIIARKAQAGTLAEEELIDLSNEAPAKCPYDPSKIHLAFDTPLELQISKPLGFRLP